MHVGDLEALEKRAIERAREALAQRPRLRLHQPPDKRPVREQREPPPNSRLPWWVARLWDRLGFRAYGERMQRDHDARSSR